MGHVLLRLTVVSAKISTWRKYVGTNLEMGLDAAYAQADERQPKAFLPLWKS